jgi:hypothetical protein
MLFKCIFNKKKTPNHKYKKKVLTCLFNSLRYGLDNIFQHKRMDIYVLLMYFLISREKNIIVNKKS